MLGELELDAMNSPAGPLSLHSLAGAASVLQLAQDLLQVPESSTR